MMPWTCVLLVATDEASLALRRFASAPCSARPYGMSIHDARALIGTAPIIVSERGTWDVAIEQPPKSDPRWPAVCACGYQFQGQDHWQLSTDRIYTRGDTGARLTLDDVEPGMIWDAPWYLDFNPPWAGPDGRSLLIRLPGGGEWAIDGPASNGPGWERTGEPPRITARPSILSHALGNVTGYHGYLTDGELSDDLEGRTY